MVPAVIIGPRPPLSASGYHGEYIDTIIGIKGGVNSPQVVNMTAVNQKDNFRAEFFLCPLCRFVHFFDGENFLPKFVSVEIAKRAGQVSGGFLIRNVRFEASGEIPNIGKKPDPHTSNSGLAK